jgi:hypothetical protein
VLEHVVVLLLLGALALVLATTYPLVLGVVDGHRPDPARRGIARMVRSRGWAVGEPATRAPSRYAPTPRARHGSSALERLLFGSDGLERARPERARPEPPTSAEAGIAVPKTVLRMRSAASATADPVLVVTPAMRLIVAQDRGEWLLCAVREEERTVLGWLRRRDVRLER